jgi:hypothetical protein
MSRLHPRLTKIEISKEDLARIKLAKQKEEIKTGIKLLTAAFLSLIIKDGIQSRNLQ